MKFKDLYELEKYLQIAYLEYRDRQQAYFQLQFVEVNVGSNEKVDIYSQCVRTVRLANIESILQILTGNKKSITLVLPQHSKMKMLKRQQSKEPMPK